VVLISLKNWREIEVNDKGASQRWNRRKEKKEWKERKKGGKQIHVEEEKRKKR
jgi:hypothetical protein